MDEEGEEVVAIALVLDGEAVVAEERGDRPLELSAVTTGAIVGKGAAVAGNDRPLPDK
ncbi:hypothetical protein [Streptomyces sp. NPDC050738]|uniref:hypothetical protein n=1 Tax=Streptomyces sp. NPDC050738 TaxID=3154744 RepID=UPI00342DB005